MVKYSKKVKRRRHHDTKNIHAGVQAKLVIEVLQGEKELNTIAAENSISQICCETGSGVLENAGRALTAVGRQRKLAERRPT